MCCTAPTRSSASGGLLVRPALNPQTRSRRGSRTCVRYSQTTAGLYMSKLRQTWTPFRMTQVSAGMLDKWQSMSSSLLPYVKLGCRQGAWARPQ